MSFKLRRVLQAECKEVLCTDPFLDLPSLVPLEDVLKTADVISIGVLHSAYRSLNFAGKPVYDIWNMTAERISVL